MGINLKASYWFYQRQYKLKTFAHRMWDGRSKPQIKAGLILLVLVYMVA